MAKKQNRTALMGSLLVGVGLLITGCTPTPMSKFEVQRPAKLTIRKEIKKIFIDPNLVNNSNDKLGIKMQALEKLQKKLNESGRFQAIMGPIRGIDQEKETVALVQGNVISREETETGQFSEVATCEGGISGLASGITATQTSKQGVTLSKRGLPCKAGDIKADMVGAGVTGLLSLAGVETETSPVDEVVRIYKYRNVTIFAQLDLSITMIGKSRETIAIRSDSANFGRHMVQPAINVHETYMTVAEVLPLIAVPVTPLHNRKYAVVEETNPGSPKGDWYKRMARTTKKLKAGEKKKIVGQLVGKIMQPFFQTISPYKTIIRAEIAVGGNADVKELILKKKWKKARSILEKLSSKQPEDLYNLGLIYEVQAVTVEDYEEAKRLYLQAFNQNGLEIFAQGIGRMERRLKESRKLAQQTQKI